MRCQISDAHSRVATRPWETAATFDSTLRAASNSTDHDQIRDAATKLVSSALVLPALESLRDSPFRMAGPFAAGAAEKRFGPLLDQQFADRITKSANFGLIDRIVERFEQMMSSAKSAGGAAEVSHGGS